MPSARCGQPQPGPSPVFMLGFELFRSTPGQRMESRAAVVLGAAFRRANPIFLLDTVEARIERTLADGKPFPGKLARTATDRATVQGDRSPTRWMTSG